jgi:hypothetical protein
MDIRDHDEDIHIQFTIALLLLLVIYVAIVCTRKYYFILYFISYRVRRVILLSFGMACCIGVHTYMLFVISCCTVIYIFIYCCKRSCSILMIHDTSYIILLYEEEASITTKNSILNFKIVKILVLQVVLEDLDSIF